MNELGKNYDIDFRKKIETQILGSIIALPDAKAIPEIMRVHNLLPKDFYAPIHKEIFRAILECYENNIEPDVVNVTNFRPTEYRENNSKHWEYPIMNILQQSNMSYAMLDTHIMLLKQYVIMDYWNVTSHNLLYGNWNHKDVLQVSDEVITGYNKLFERITIGIRQNNENDYEEEIQMKVDRFTRGKAVGITTSVEVIDEFTGGYSLGELIIIAARPGMGKTTYALISAWNTAQAGNKVVFFSLEMAKNQLISKLASLITKIPYKRIKKGALTSEELAEVLKAHKYIANSTLHIDDEIKTIEDIIEKSAVYVTTLGTRLFFMDYIQRCNSRVKNMEPRILVTVITRELKSIAKGHYVAFVALSQLSRAVEKRENKRPLLSDLKESSSIEEDADIVAFLYREGYYDAQRGMLPGYSELFHVEFIIGKGRDIGTRVIHLFMDPIKMFIATYNSLGNYDE